MRLQDALFYFKSIDDKTLDFLQFSANNLNEVAGLCV